MTNREPVPLSAAIEPVMREIDDKQQRLTRYLSDADGYSTQHAQRVLDTWTRTVHRRRVLLGLRE